MSKKRKNNKVHKNAKPSKKQTAAQQKRAARAAAKETANRVKTLAKQGLGKTTAQKAAQLADMGYKNKTAVAAAKGGKGGIKAMHAKRVEEISGKLLNSRNALNNELRAMIDEQFPGARFTTDALADLIAQGRYEEYVEEYHRDLYTYEKALYDRAETAIQDASPHADKLMQIADDFAELLKRYLRG